MYNIYIRSRGTPSTSNGRSRSMFIDLIGPIRCVWKGTVTRYFPFYCVCRRYGFPGYLTPGQVNPFHQGVWSSLPPILTVYRVWSMIDDRRRSKKFRKIAHYAVGDGYLIGIYDQHFVHSNNTNSRAAFWFFNFGILFLKLSYLSSTDLQKKYI